MPAPQSVSLPDRIGGLIPLPLPVPNWSKPIIAALLLLCVGLGARARLAGRRARRLERNQQALSADIGLMQSALVPKIPPSLGALAISGAYRPADGPAAGGDFYDAFELADGRVVVILGDVSGHGRTALAHAARMRYTVRAYAEAGLPPREVLKLAGSTMGTSADGLYTTVLVAVHDPATASLAYASAGHPPPVFLGASIHEPLTCCASPPLGWGFPSGRRQTTVPFPGGARACFFSDGLIEARTGQALLGRERIAELFAGLGPRPSAVALLNRVEDCASEVRDDMAACIVEGTNPRLGAVNDIWLEEVELDQEQLERGHAERFLMACGLSGAETIDPLNRIRAMVADHGAGVLTVTLPRRFWAVGPPSGSPVASLTAPPLSPVAISEA